MGQFRHERFLEEQRRHVVLQRPDHRSGDVGGPSTVRVDGDVTSTHRRGRRLDTLDHALHGEAGLEVTHPSRCVHLHRGVPLGRADGCMFRDLGGVVTADPDVGTDPVANGPAEQVVDRDAERLAAHVPERLVDAGDRGRALRAPR